MRKLQIERDYNYQKKYKQNLLQPTKGVEVLLAIVR
jgi:hypothetical protein